MGREGMSRRHAAYKMVAMVLGTDIVRGSSASPKRIASPPTRVTRSRSATPDARLKSSLESEGSDDG